MTRVYVTTDYFNLTAHKDEEGNNHLNVVRKSDGAELNLKGEKAQHVYAKLVGAAEEMAKLAFTEDKK